MEKNIYRKYIAIIFAMISAVMMLLSGCASKAVTAQEKAEEYIADGRYNDAIEQLETVISKADQSDPVESGMLIEAYYLEGDCYYRMGDRTKSDELYKKALNVDEAYPNAERTATDYLRIGMAYVGLEDYTSAMNAFNEGLSKSETACEKELMHNYIICAEKIGDWETAKNTLKIYVEKFPDDADMIKEQEFLSTR